MAYSTAQHAVSGLSWLHPRLGEECITQGVSLVCFNLITSEICSEQYRASLPTSGAVRGLSRKFEAIAKSEGFQLSEFQTAEIGFNYAEAAWPRSCVVRIVGRANREVLAKVDWLGRKYRAERGLANEFS